MDNNLNAFFRAFLEAVTEFLPVSSTGHLFLFSRFFPFQGLGENTEAFEDLFDIFIQSGAILSVVVLYAGKFLVEGKRALQYFQKKSPDPEGWHFYRGIVLGILPILVLGFLLKKPLDLIKSRPDLLAILGVSWILGGLVMIFVERKNLAVESSTKLLPRGREAILIGLFQCLALVPGVSRSAATIIAGRAFGLSRKGAAEYSFFLAVPVLLLAGLYKLTKHASILNLEMLSLLLFGSIVSFLLCFFVIKLFLSFLKKRSFVPFGVYRLILGTVVLLVYFQGL